MNPIIKPQISAFYLLLKSFFMAICVKQQYPVYGYNSAMGLLPDTYNCGLRMHRECRERFPRHRLQMKPLVNDPGMHHGTCVTPAVMHIGIANPNPRWRVKRSRHSRRMRNPQFCVSDKRPMQAD